MGIKKQVHLNKVGNYTASNFKTLDGQDLNTFSDFQIPYTNMRTDISYKGQFVKCKYSGSKMMKINELYYVEDEHNVSKYYAYNRSSYTEKKFKIRGINNLVGIHNFEEISKSEQRSIKLKNLKGEKTKTGDQTRKFLLYTDREKLAILIELLTKILVDINNIELLENHKLDIIDLILRKGNKYNMKREDIIFFYDNIRPLLAPYSDIIK